MAKIVAIFFLVSLIVPVIPFPMNSSTAAEFRGQCGLPGPTVLVFASLPFLLTNWRFGPVLIPFFVPSVRDTNPALYFPPYTDSHDRWVLC